MRVLIVDPSVHEKWDSPTDGWGGIEKVCYYRWLELSRMGHHLQLVKGNKEELEKYIADFEPNVVSTHAFFHPKILRDACNAASSKLVFTSHKCNWLLGAPPEDINAIKYCDGFVALSDLIFQKTNKLINNCIHIHNGVDTNVFIPLKKQPNTYLCVGKHDKRKKFSLVSRIIASNPNKELTIIGPSGDDTNDIVLAPNVKILGNLSEGKVAEHMGRSEYLVHLCELEAGASLVVKEAMACECKVITSDYCASCVENVSTEWVSHDKDLGIRARKEIIEKYTWARIAQQLSSFYEDLIK